MKKRKLIRLLRACGPNELDELERFLASPYHNRDETVRRLFDVLKGFHPDFDSPELDKRKVFEAVFPGRPFSDKPLRYLLSGLNKLTEQFIATQKLEQHPYQTTLALLESLSERGLQKAYDQINRQLEQEILSTEGKSNAFFFARLQWSAIKEQHFQQQRVRKFDPGLQYFADDLDKYYYFNRLKTACAMLDRQTIFQADYQLNLSAAWMQHLEAHRFFAEPVIEVYYVIFQALQDETQEHYFEHLKAFLYGAPAGIAREELKNIYLFAINYCARKIRQGREGFVTEALRLYRTGIETGLLIDENGLSPWAFTNVIKLSLRLQQYDWIEAFIQAYAPRLPEAFRENALHYNMAELYYYTRRFEQAQEHLIRVAYSDLNYYLGARVLLAKIYYETAEEEALLSLLSSFTIFLKRNKELSNNLKYTYLNFCQILFQIVRRSPIQMKRLPQKIAASTLLTDRAWLERMYRDVMGWRGNN